MTNIGTTYGAILAGASLAFALSGAISLQCIVYFKTYPHDGPRVKTLVCTVWFLDILHSSFICVSLLIYFITFFGEVEKIDYIPWSIALSVMVTALQTYLVHCFFAQKILEASGRNWLITGPMIILASGRLFAASISTFEMVRLHQFSTFIQRYPGWVFTTGLSLSSGVDIIIMGWLCYYLRTIRTRIASDSTILIRLVDLTTIYTLESGALTCFTTIVTLICWLTMPKNLVFLGLHLVIGKLYANSLLASLNIRRELEDIRWKSQNLNTSSNHHHLDLTESSVYSSLARSLDLSPESDICVPTLKARRFRVTGSADFNTGRRRRSYLRQYQPREPTILELRAEAPV